MPTPTSHQPDFADSPNATDEWVRGGLEGDRIPLEPVNVPAIIVWAWLTGPWMNPAQRQALQTVAAFFTINTKWLRIDHAALAKAMGCSVPTLISRLADLVELEVLIVNPIYRHNLRKVNEYSISGAWNGYTAAPQGEPVTDPVRAYKDTKLAASQAAATALRTYCAELEEALGEGHPAIKDFNREEGEELAYSYLSNKDESPSSPPPSPAIKNLNSGPNAPDPLREKVLSHWKLLGKPHAKGGWNTIAGAMSVYRGDPDRLDRDIEDRKIEQGLLQPVADQEEPAEPVQRYSVDTAGAYPKEVWEETLASLEQSHNRNLFETVIRHTVGHHIDGDTLIVLARSEFEIEILEQRLYGSIVKALREAAGREDLDVRFGIAATE